MEEIEESYSIIPAKVLYNKGLKANEKLLYSMILSLSFQKGYCYATNNYFAEKLDANPKTVSDWISDLRDKNFIKCEYVKGENKQIIQRKIYINDIPFPLNNGYLYSSEKNLTLFSSIRLLEKDYNIVFSNEIKSKLNLYRNVINVHKHGSGISFEEIIKEYDFILNNKTVNNNDSSFVFKPDYINVNDIYNVINKFVYEINLECGD